MRKILALLFLVMSSRLLAQTPGPEDSPDTNTPPPAEEIKLSAPFDDIRKAYFIPDYLYVPENNPTTPEKVALGKVLFFDPRLSGNNSMSCATCHNPDLGWSDGLPTAIGAGGKVLARRTPSLLNVIMNQSLQWDGEFQELEMQALAPIRKKTEMNQDLNRLPAKLAKIKGYAPLFEKAFPGEGINLLTISRSLAAFQRTIVSSNSPFERFIKGDDNAMSVDAKMGVDIFRNKGRCAICHTGWKMSDESFYDIGIKSNDKGRGTLTKEKWNDFKFKNQKLLDAAAHPPYMHDGSLPDLKAVIEFYNRGGDAKRPGLSPDIKARDLTELEKNQLLAFLNALTSPKVPFERPVLPE